LAISKITGLQGALDGKAPTSHTHTISDITGLQTALDGKAPTSHTHTIANVTGLQTALDGKAPTSHTHAITDITNLQTTLGSLQPRINSTAGQIIIGNGDGITTTSTGLTWTTNTLNATNLTTTNTLTTPNLAVSTQATITQLLTTTGGTLGTDMFSLVNNSANSLRFSQVYIGANDQKWLLIQKTNNGDNTIFNFRNGNIAVGTFSNPAYRIDLVGDINITGEFRKNTNIYKPANAVLADTATVATSLATSRNIAGTPFNGTADINIDYNALTNRPIILQPTTTNLQLVSGYTLSVPGNVGVGTTAIATNVLQVGSGARLRIANGSTDYTIIGTNDTDGANNTQIIISGNTRATNAGNIQYLATATNGSHLFYTTATSIRMTINSAGVNINNDLGVTGNVGIGTAPSATYKVNINGTLNATNVLLNGSAITGSKWSVGTPSTAICYNSGNVGIGNTTPLGTLHLGDASKANNDGNIIFAKCTTVGSTRICRVGYNNSFEFVIGDTGGGNTLGTWLEQFKIHYTAPANSLVINNVGNISMPNTVSIGTDRWHSSTEGAARVYYAINGPTYLRGHSGTPFVFRNGGDSDVGNISSGGNLTMLGEGRFQGNALIINGNAPTIYFRDTDQRQGMIHINSGLMYFLSGPVVGTSGSEQNWSTNGNLWPLYINLNNNDATFGGQIQATFYAVNNTNTDYLCVQQNYGSIGSGANLQIKVAFGSFTAFHRCYTDDELYNNETNESIDLFKNNYMGRVVIATGKIKTDFTRKKETDAEPEPIPELIINGLPQPTGGKQVEDEWYCGIDKDGISIEDAVPVVALSRQRKDKRVFGVLGMPKRSTNNKDRLIVNSIGEGGICVSNTNGNIENGDYIQSSDLLGYGEKQDDDLLHNYTIAKATIDCNFELDSPYYQCHEIENGVRVAFIACSYHCG
jgi:hypothetical protein